MSNHETVGVRRFSTISVSAAEAARTVRSGEVLPQDKRPYALTGGKGETEKTTDSKPRPM
jgi:hypothetical protein